MLELKYKEYHNTSYSNLQNCELQIPKLCPCCGVAHNPNITLEFTRTVNEVPVYGFSHNCPNCKKNSLSINTFAPIENNRYVDLLLSYPNANPIEFDEKLTNLSPRFVSLYNQAHFCEENNFIDLAGMGYRASMEVLLKDYALDFELDTQENIAKLNLNRAIETFFKNDQVAYVASDVVRIIGNDFTHWDKSEQYSIEELKQYLEIFIQAIKFQLMIKHPPVSRHQN